MAEIRVGTSGWHYGHWRESFYPAGLKPGDWLSWYAQRFDSVEINNSFYRLPSRDTFSSWSQKVPPGFVFAVKASRFITHRKRLRAPEESLSGLLHNTSGLGNKLGPFLFQLPPRWRADPQRLREFVSSLPAGMRYAFEFRDESWLREDVYGILRAAGCALCVADSPAFPRSREVTADFVFMRFHGGETLYGSRYSRGELEEWAAFARVQLQDGRDVYAYFNNDACGYAPEDASTFRALVSA